MAPASGAEGRPVEERLVRVFCDADVLIAGAASTRGASHILLQLSELTLIDCVSSPAAIAEAERNIAEKLPAASSAFRKILAAAVDVVPEANSLCGSSQRAFHMRSKRFGSADNADGRRCLLVARFAHT